MELGPKNHTIKSFRSPNSRMAVGASPHARVLGHTPELSASPGDFLRERRAGCAEQSCNPGSDWKHEVLPVVCNLASAVMFHCSLLHPPRNKEFELC